MLLDIPQWPLFQEWFRWGDWVGSELTSWIEWEKEERRRVIFYLTASHQITFLPPCWVCMTWSREQMRSDASDPFSTMREECSIVGKAINHPAKKGRERGGGISSKEWRRKSIHPFVKGEWRDRTTMDGKKGGGGRRRCPSSTGFLLLISHTTTTAYLLWYSYMSALF